MAQNIVNCVTVGWQTVCYFNRCLLVLFLLSVPFLSFLVSPLRSHTVSVSLFSLLTRYIFLLLPNMASCSLYLHALLPSFGLSSQFLSSHIIFFISFYTSSLRISCPALWLSTETGRT